MAKKTTMGEQRRVVKPKKRRPGVHAKTKRDHSKQGKQWLKLSRGQG